jgi:hypothetical protein
MLAEREIKKLDTKGKRRVIAFSSFLLLPLLLVTADPTVF